MATPTRAARLHKAIGVTAMWSSCGEFFCGPQRWEPQQEVAQPGRGGSCRWSTGCRTWSWDQTLRWSWICWALLWKLTSRWTSSRPDPEPAQSQRSHPQSMNHFSPYFRCVANLALSHTCNSSANLMLTCSYLPDSQHNRRRHCEIQRLLYLWLCYQKKSHCLSWSFLRTNLVLFFFAINLEPKIQQKAKLSGLSFWNRTTR